MRQKNNPARAGKVAFATFPTRTKLSKNGSGKLTNASLMAARAAGIRRERSELLLAVETANLLPSDAVAGVFSHVASRAGPVGRDPGGRLAAVTASDPHRRHRRFRPTQTAVRAGRVFRVRNEITLAVRAFDVCVHSLGPLFVESPLRNGERLYREVRLKAPVLLVAITSHGTAVRGAIAQPAGRTDFVLPMKVKPQRRVENAVKTHPS